jgi:hypothetical protein
MKDYEIIIRLQDPAFDKVIKKAIPSTKENAQEVWKLKEKKETVTLTHDGMEYLLSPGDILQIRQMQYGHSGAEIDAKGYQRSIVASHKMLKDDDGVYRDFYVFEVCRIKKDKYGWQDSEYKEVYRMSEDAFLITDEDRINQIFWKLENEYLKKK